MAWQPTKAQLDQAFDHARASMPMESCGVIIAGAFHAVHNLAEEINYFVMDMREVVDLIARHGPLQAIVHSHAFLPAHASIADLVSCEKHGLPWLIVAMPTRQYLVIEPKGYAAPLIGRPWAWGTLDCYGLVRDAYATLGGIELKDYPRDWGWWERGENIIADQFLDAGFVELDQDAPYQHLDVIGMQVRCQVVNHVGVWLEGDDILHHLAGRNSVREPFGGLYRKATRFHLRHKDIIAIGVLSKREQLENAT